jgi:Tol biopolymer transport system component
VYLVPADGGVPVEAYKDAADQGIPTWSPDGQRIVFGELLYRKPREEMMVHVLDLERHTLAILPGSKGVWTPRWSPDGRFILGMSPDQEKLRLFDWDTSSWRDLVEIRAINFPAWAPDSSSIAFIAYDLTVVPNREGLKALYRFDIRRNKLERVASLEHFASPPGLEWYGVAPDGSLLGIRDVRIQELYALNLSR